MDPIKLEGAGGYLLLDMNDFGWCHCYFADAANERRRIGAEMIFAIRKNLTTALTADLEPIEYIQGQHAALALKLQKAPSAIYVARSIDVTTLFLRDENAAVFASIRLNHEEIQKWLALLA